MIVPRVSKEEIILCRYILPPIMLFFAWVLMRFIILPTYTPFETIIKHENIKATSVECADGFYGEIIINDVSLELNDTLCYQILNILKSEPFDISYAISGYGDNRHVLSITHENIPLLREEEVRTQFLMQQICMGLLVPAPLLLIWGAIIFFITAGQFKEYRYKARGNSTKSSRTLGKCLPVPLLLLFAWGIADFVLLPIYTENSRIENNIDEVVHSFECRYRKGWGMVIINGAPASMSLSECRAITDMMADQKIDIKYAISAYSGARSILSVKYAGYELVNENDEWVEWLIFVVLFSVTALPLCICFVVISYWAILI